MLGAQLDRTPIRITPYEGDYITILVLDNQQALFESLRLPGLRPTPLRLKTY